MSELVPAEDIERIVGATREQSSHIGRAVSADCEVYILHSIDCLRVRPDLRKCPFSIALDRGIIVSKWIEDVPVTLQIAGGRLEPA